MEKGKEGETLNKNFNTPKRKYPNIQDFVKWLALILLALLMVAYIFRQLSWT
jgi:hypothetical protein